MSSSVAPAAAGTCPVPNLGSLPDDALLTRGQVSAISGFAVHTLKVWAAAGRGPRVTTVEGRPRYRVRDTRQWLGAAV